MQGLSSQQHNCFARRVPAFAMPLHAWIHRGCSGANQFVSVQRVSYKFILPWQQGQQHHPVSQFHVFQIRSLIIEPVCLPSQCILALWPQLHVQQRIILATSEQRLGHMAMRIVSSWQLLCARRLQVVPGWVLLPCSCKLPYCLSSWHILSGICIHSNHMPSSKLLSQW